MSSPLTGASPLLSIIAALDDSDPNHVAAAARIIHGHCQASEESRMSYPALGAIPALLAALTRLRPHIFVQEAVCWALRWIGKDAEMNSVFDD